MMWVRRASWKENACSNNFQMTDEKSHKTKSANYFMKIFPPKFFLSSKCFTQKLSKNWIWKQISLSSCWALNNIKSIEISPPAFLYESYFTKVMLEDENRKETYEGGKSSSKIRQYQTHFISTTLVNRTQVRGDFFHKKETRKDLMRCNLFLLPSS